MGSPFITRPEIIMPLSSESATDAQKSFVRSLLSERQWGVSPWATRIAQIIAEDFSELTKKAASTLIEHLKELPKQEQRVKIAPSRVVTEVPAGRYAVDTSDGAINELAFYKIDRPTEGRWAGYVFVKLIVGSDERNLSRTAGQSILDKIAAVGPEAAMARYGHEIGECGMCGRQLTNDESRERGIGPVCLAKAGW
jgi:hypothetical protein